MNIERQILSDAIETALELEKEVKLWKMLSLFLFLCCSALFVVMLL